MMYSFSNLSSDIDLHSLIKEYLSKHFKNLIFGEIKNNNKIEGYVYTVEIENRLKVYAFSNTYNLIPLWRRQIKRNRQKEILNEFKRVLNEAN